MNQNLPDSRVRNKKVRYEHLSFLNSVLLDGAKTRSCHLSLSKVCCIHFCVRTQKKTFLSTSMPLSASPPLQIFLAVLICMSPISLSKCIMTFSHLCGYDHLRVRTHARIEITLCSSLTMRVATRRTGVTTSVVTEIPRRGMHDMVVHARYQWNLRWKVRSARTKELEHKGKY